MLGRALGVLLLLLHLPASFASPPRPIFPFPPDEPSPRLPGHFEPFEKLYKCPELLPRPVPTSARDVRPDDIKVFIALGDSITAGFLARSSDDPPETFARARQSQVVFSTPHETEFDHSDTPDAKAEGIWPARKTSFKEWRGLSYPIGGDDGAITLPNILSRWTNTTGSSLTPSPTDWSIFHWLFGKDKYRSPAGLNAAIGGSTSPSLLSQARDVILRMKAMDISPHDWKFVNIGIGANDLCAFCLSANSTLPLLGTPEGFARGIYDAVELLRKHVPHLIVNIIGLFHVSSVYALTLKDPYCRGPFLPPVPHLPLECNCAFLPGPAGEYTRQKMDELSEQYDQAVLKLIEAWEAEGDDGFGATWQPGSMIDIANWPIQALSPADCFHPSEAAHQRVAAGLFNRLTLTMTEKATPIRWTDAVLVRCLEHDDRISIGIERT